MKPQDNCQNRPTANLSTPKTAERPDVIAVRKTCDASGTGLSHYVLMDKEVRR